MTPHEQDIAFLVKRQREAGSCSFTGDRWTGLSSNAIVAFAYGGEQDALPYDRGDYAACVRTVRMLPPHRRTSAVLGALWKAKAHYLERYPSHASSLTRRVERERREKEKAERQKRSDAYYARKHRKSSEQHRKSANKPHSVRS